MLYLIDRAEWRMIPSMNIQCYAWSVFDAELKDIGDMGQSAVCAQSRRGTAFVISRSRWSRLWPGNCDYGSTFVEFVCIPRPLERSDRPDGGPLTYRVLHRARLWKAGESPKLEQEILEGDPRYCI